MYRVRNKFQKLQHDPTLTPSTSTTDLWPKQFIKQHDCDTMTQSKLHDTHDFDTYTNVYSAIEQQIRLDVMLSR